ncbi:MAG: hypothetical protein V1791_04770, partial [Pseudomonadota bacterium]
MTQSTTPATLPPLLKRFHTYIPGDIHDVAAKVHLIAGFEACKGNTLADAVWNEDKTALIVSFGDGGEVTLLVEGYRLLTKCSCRQWQPARNCPHVVIAWAILKRTVTPGALAHIHFNQRMLLDIKRYIEREPVSNSRAGAVDTEKQRKMKNYRAASPGPRNEQLVSNASSPGLPRFRLLIEAGCSPGKVSGRIMRDNEVVTGWTATGIPTDLARFMASIVN